MKYCVIVCCFFLQGCNIPKPERESLVGTWKAQDGAMLALYRNGNCKIVKFKNQSSSRQGKDTTYVVSNNGIWEFVAYERGVGVDISYPESKSYEYKGKAVQSEIVIHLYVSGQGFLENRPPWNLYLLIGDPDDGNKYLFTKQE